MPSRITAIQKAIASTSRLETLRFLLQVGSATKTELVSATGMSLAAARDAVDELEQLGYVLPDIPRPHDGRLVHYSARRDTITDDLAALVAWTLR